MSTMDTVILELFQEEVGTQSETMVDGLLSMERSGEGNDILTALLRASHALKGAARLALVPGAEKLAHAMEDCFVAVQKGQLKLSADRIDVLLKAVDMIGRLAAQGVNPGDSPPALDDEANVLVDRVRELLSGAPPPTYPGAGPVPPADVEAPALSPLERGEALVSPLVSSEPSPASQTAEASLEPISSSAIASKGSASELQFVNLPAAARSLVSPPLPPQAAGARTGQNLTPSTVKAEPAVQAKATKSPAFGAPKRRPVRVAAERLDTILGLAGELEIAVRWFRGAIETLGRQVPRRRAVEGMVHEMRALIVSGAEQEEVLRRLDLIGEDLRRDGGDIDCSVQGMSAHEMRMSQLADDMMDEVLKSRMRPFKDITTGLPRMVRHLARELGKEVRLEIQGQDTPIDRDVLEQVEGPITQILRNALDHGLEKPADREAAGKPREGVLRVAALQRSGALSVIVEDDGRGVELGALRDRVVARGMVHPDVVHSLSEAELLDFLFLPRFSTRDEVTTISGRGVGLDVVRSALRSMRGTVTVVNRPGQGLSFELNLPISLAVVRTLLVTIAAETYALPLSRVVSVLTFRRDEIYTSHGRPHVDWDGVQLGLVAAAELLGLGSEGPWEDALFVVALGTRRRPLGLVVGGFKGQRELAVRQLDPRLGKVPDVSAAALLDDGTPVLILDADDLAQSIERRANTSQLPVIEPSESEEAGRGRILIVEDSATVRALEKRLLEAAGFDVTVAVDGAEGWNLVRQDSYDLMITDIDMPRMDGFELLSRVRADAKLRALPVVIVSYKDQEYYRIRGLELGADRYLTKGSFHNHTFVEVVQDLMALA